MTYNVFGGTLNSTLPLCSTNMAMVCVKRTIGVLQAVMCVCL